MIEHGLLLLGLVLYGIQPQLLLGKQLMATELEPQKIRIKEKDSFVLKHIHTFFYSVRSIS